VKLGDFGLAILTSHGQAAVAERAATAARSPAVAVEQDGTDRDSGLGGQLESLSDADRNAGTAIYVPPRRDFSSADDMYAVGIITFEMFCEFTVSSNFCFRSKL
jgi:serine/threonine protein kinase